MLAPLERHGPALGRCSGQESTWATGGILPFPDKLAKSFLSVKIEISATWTLLYLQNFMILDVNALWNNFLNSSKTMILNPPNAVTFNTVRHVVVTPINWIISLLQFHYCYELYIWLCDSQKCGYTKAENHCSKNKQCNVFKYK